VHQIGNGPVIATLGRADELARSGRLDSLAVSLGRFCDEAVVLNMYREGSVQAEWRRSWGPVLIFRSIWERLKLHDIECIDGRSFEFDVETAIFAVALQRLLQPEATCKAAAGSTARCSRPSGRRNCTTSLELLTCCTSTGSVSRRSCSRLGARPSALKWMSCPSTRRHDYAVLRG
jgi:hypothetical protein